jgi:hypothetical protein
MKWFGKHPWAPVCDDARHAPTPVGQRCAWCDEPFTEGDDGLLIPLLADTVSEAPYHVECQLRSIIGGVNHLRGCCTCCPGGKEPPDPPWLTKRQGARAAAALWRGRQ